LLAAEAAGYEVLVTVDQGIPRQQHPAARKLLPLVGAILNVLKTIAPGQILTVP